ncbi:uncharacterized protein LOC119776061, partial [Cyprinodon tularosa]|uniref:uncharacterized protein LOC119776061 n=1 Tax=Cyprinodon tularosa TaxID=77115 RepID=UPI0018E27E2C
MRDSKAQLDPVICLSNNQRHVQSPANGLSARDPGKIKVQRPGWNPNNSEKDQKKEMTDFSGTKTFSPQLSYRVCIHHELPLRSWSSAVFLDKSLCISLAELAAGVRRVQVPLYRSALTCQLGVQSLCRSTTDKKPAKTSEDYRRGNFSRCNVQKMRLDHTGSPFSKHCGPREDQKALACGVNSKDDDWEKQSHSTSLSFREPSSFNTKAAKQKGNANEAAVSAQSNSRHRKHTITVRPESEMMSKWGGQKAEEDQEGSKSIEAQTISTCHHHSQLQNDTVGGTPKTLSLKEALELFRPDFISRSQGRVRRLEQRARRRRALRDSNPDLLKALYEDRDKYKRNCTTPDPLS